MNTRPARSWALAAALLATACSSDEDATLDLFFVLADGFVPEAAELEVRSTDVGYQETRPLAGTARIGARLTGAGSQPWSLEVITRSQRERELLVQPLSGSFRDAGSLQTIDVSLTPECAVTECIVGERCVAGFCQSACLTDRCELPEPGRVYVDAQRGVDRPETCTSESTPCATIAFALENYAASNRVIEVHGGGGTFRYSGFDVRPEWSGTAEIPLVIRAWPGTGRPTVEGSDAVAVQVAAGVANVTVAGFLISDAAQGIRIQDADAVRVRNLVITGLSLSGGGSAIEVSDSRGVEVLDSLVFNNASTGADEVDGIRGRGSDLLLTRNSIAGHRGWQIDIAGDRNTIRDNLVISGLRGVRARSGSEASILNNRICDIEGDAIFLDGNSAWRVEFNTLLEAENGVRLRSTDGGRLANNLVVDQRRVGLFNEGALTPPLNANNLVVGSGESDRVAITSDNPDSELTERPILVPDLTVETCAEASLSGDEPANQGAADGGPLGAERIRAIPLTVDPPPAEGDGLSTLRVEAEDFELLEGFEVRESGSASGGEWIEISDESPGVARYTFEGAPGLYDLRILYFDENDGNSTASVFIADAPVDSWTWDADLGSSNAGIVTRQQRFIGDVELNTGTEIRIEGMADGGERLRLDVIEFTPSVAPDTSNGNSRVEAEDLTLSGFSVADSDNASGGQWIQVSDSSGVASLDFPLSDGEFDVTVSYFDENDGEASTTLSVNGTEVDSWTWDQDLGSSLATSATRVSRVISALTLNTGDRIELAATRNGQEPARIDFVEFARR
ncbi:MAG: right-handed parallel beta-helix repeat-containing protein [Myxococcota bacterium]